MGRALSFVFGPHLQETSNNYITRGMSSASGFPSLIWMKVVFILGLVTAVAYLYIYTHDVYSSVLYIASVVYINHL